MDSKTPTAILIAKPPYHSWVLALSFDPTMEPRSLIDTLKHSGYQETLVCTPYNGYESRHYWKGEAAASAPRPLDEIKIILSNHGIIDCHEVRLTWHDTH